MATFVIAEVGSSHDNSIDKAYRLILAAKECGADAVKFQYWSDAAKLAKRRGLGAEAEAVYRKYQLPQGWLMMLKAKCEEVGIEFMCTVYLIEDIATIAPLVKRFKVSAFEADWDEFLWAHHPFAKPVIVSNNGSMGDKSLSMADDMGNVSILHCVSEYPTHLEKVSLRGVRVWHGFSDHTANVLTGCAAVAAGAEIVEAHIRLDDTERDNPDYGHSLCAEDEIQHSLHFEAGAFERYVRNIRTVERML